MDRKINDKERVIKEVELEKMKKIKEAEAKKEMETKLKSVILKKENKQKKQQKKDLKKKKKSTLKTEIGPKEKVFAEIPNIVNVPENCKHLVNEDDVLYLVPGDGSCGPNCASAFLFMDKIYGPKLRKMMNIFFADHWYDRY